MAKLTTAARKKIPAQKFAGPNRSYPIENKAHAANAIGRATQQVNAGKLSPAAGNLIKAKARKAGG